MIYQREIIQKADEWGVTLNIVDKDYVLGHFLHCFFSFQNNKDLFVFKGGTCLRKCYFPDYRFSEDLDFTLLDQKFEITENWIKQITENCSHRTGIRFHLLKFEEKYFNDIKKGYQCVIAFWGANHNQNTPPPAVERWTTKIELDISFDEQVIFQANNQAVNHPYSDIDQLGALTIPTYSLEEILLEKVRAFYQRSYKAPRDFYDVWYLMNNHQFEDWNKIWDALLIKCQLKNITIDKYIFNDDVIYKSVKLAWVRSIAHHLPAGQLPAFDEVWDYLKTNLFGSFPENQLEN